MDTKKSIWVGVFVGSTVGSYIPELWGAGFLSFSSLFFSAVGSLIGIYFGYQLSRD